MALYSQCSRTSNSYIKKRGTPHYSLRTEDLMVTMPDCLLTVGDTWRLTKETTVMEGFYEDCITLPISCLQNQIWTACKAVSVASRWSV